MKYIIDECLFINEVITSDIKKQDLPEDEILKRAVVRSLEIIGEATKKIPADIKLTWDNINWRNMAGMRDKLIHDYFEINYSVVWDVVKNKIPELIEQIDKIITEN